MTAVTPKKVKRPKVRTYKELGLSISSNWGPFSQLEKNDLIQGFKPVDSVLCVLCEMANTLRDIKSELAIIRQRLPPPS